tara:strand:- start:2433 stop:3524 length:1092 start_codon:yes stop_codon:yes gene_type:complete
MGLNENIICQNININTTKKKRINKNNKKELWKLYDNEFNNNNNIDNIECLYTNSESNLCELCNNILMINDEGFLTCTNTTCGIIYKNKLDYSAEWRYYGADDNSNIDPTRCGVPINPLLHESNFGCKLLINGNSTYELQKIKRYTDWQAMPYKEKSLYDEFQKIINIAQTNGIPKIITDEAMRMHKKISEVKSFRGLNRDGIIAASIYIACKINNYPRTAKEIATMFSLDNSSATKGCKNALSILNEIEQNDNTNNKVTLYKTTPICFIERYCSKLDINDELTMLCKFIANKIESLNLIPENTPHSIASGIIYFVSRTCNLNISKKSINLISDISEVTINKCFKKLEVLQNELIPKVILNKYT